MPWAPFSPPNAAADGAARPHVASERIGALAPSPLNEAQAQAGSLVSINLKAAELISAATSATNLCRMPPGWQAWL